MDKNQNIEERILWVAERLFLEKGFSGTSTTEIAKAVGCNQALIHYYFRTKEKLFWDVFTPKMDHILDYLDTPLQEAGDFFQKIHNVIDFYFSILELDSRLAPFIVNELIMHPTRWSHFRDRFLRDERRSGAFKKFEKAVEDEINKGTIREVLAIDLLMDIMSLTVSSFIVAPRGYALNECDSGERTKYLQHRKEDVIGLVVNGIRK